ncbi:hypothetical protein MKX01_032628 [Papaver californicum]|nr:hypothetical protein MKX01_032628 [Papaver californicum]
MSSVTVEVSSSQVIWKIQNFSKLNAYVISKDSDVFSVGTFKWKARIFPKGEGNVINHLSLYLIPVDSTKSASVEFSFEITSQSGRKNKKKREGRYKLAEGSSTGKGWPTFIRLSELHDPKKGYIVDDTCVIRVVVACKIKEDATDDDDGDVKEIETLQTRLGRLFSPLHNGANMSWNR